MSKSCSELDWDRSVVGQLRDLGLRDGQWTTLSNWNEGWKKPEQRVSSDDQIKMVSGTYWYCGRVVRELWGLVYIRSCVILQLDWLVFDWPSAIDSRTKSMSPAYLRPADIVISAYLDRDWPSEDRMSQFEQSSTLGLASDIIRFNPRRHVTRNNLLYSVLSS